MEATTYPKLGKQHQCGSSMRRSGLCTFGTGAPKAKKCRYCGSAIRVTEGLYGVFAHRGDGRYWASDAISLHTFDRQAQAVVDKDTTGTLVVRFLSVPALDTERPEGL